MKLLWIGTVKTAVNEHVSIMDNPYPSLAKIPAHAKYNNIISKTPNSGLFISSDRAKIVAYFL